MAVAMGLQSCFNLTDMFIIGKLPNGVEAIGALAICDMLAVMGTIVAQGISNASVGVIGRFFGRGDRAALNHATWTSVFIVLIMSLAFGLFGIFGAPFLIGDMVGAGGEVHQIAVSYLRILVGQRLLKKHQRPLAANSAQRGGGITAHGCIFVGEPLLD